MRKFIANPDTTPPSIRILSIARDTVLETWRNCFALLLAGLVNVTVLASIFVRQQATTETDRIPTVLVPSILRVTSMFAVAIYVLQGPLRELNDKVLALMLSLDPPKPCVLAVKFLDYAGVSVLCTDRGAFAVVSLRYRRCTGLKVRPYT